MPFKFTTFLVFLLIACSRITAQFDAEQPDLPLTTMEKALIVDSIVSNIQDAYVVEKTALDLKKGIRAYQRGKAYHSITSSKDFALAMNRLFLQISKDKHLRIAFSHRTVPLKNETEGPLPDFIKQFAIENNYGFNKTAILPGNLGYINIAGFFPGEEGTEAAISAMKEIAGTQALIIDLRKNTGGYSYLASFTLSYFFSPKPVLLSDIIYRKDNRREQEWTAYYVPGKRYLDKPVYILTSAETFSAGEGFAETLQSFRKAVIIGEHTGGAENMCDLIRLNDHFVMNMPVAKSVAPFHQQEHKIPGVTPDIPVKQEKALEMAQRMALEQLIKTTADADLKERLKKTLTTLQIHD